MKHSYLIAIVLGIASLLLWSAFSALKNYPQHRNGVPSSMAVSREDVYLIASVPTFYIAPLPRDLFYIVPCENIDWDIAAKNPNSTAYGLCQLLDGTWEYIQEKWDMELDRDDPNDQLYACQRLLNEEGIYPHWEAIKECLKGRVK